MAEFDDEKLFRLTFSEAELEFLLGNEEFLQRRAKLKTLAELEDFCAFASHLLDIEKELYPLKFPLR
jgi:hypothetical protein